MFFHRQGDWTRRCGGIVERSQRSSMGKQASYLAKCQWYNTLVAHVWHWLEWIVDLGVYCVKQFVGIIVWGFWPNINIIFINYFIKAIISFLIGIWEYILLFILTPLYNFFIKNIVQSFLIYNEFAENITKKSDPVQQKHYTTKKPDW